jgi:hypothetical protein
MQGTIPQHVAIGSLLVVATTMIHATAMIGAVRWFTRIRSEHGAMRAGWRRGLHVATIVLIMFFAGVVESGAWALVYLLLDVMPNFEHAIYFSTVTYTSLGYGDMVIDGPWRLLAAFEAANGVIMFGWTTAIIVAAVQRLYFGQHPEPANPAEERGGSKGTHHV